MDEDERDRIERMFLEQGVNPWRLFQARAHLAGMRAVDLDRNPPEPEANARVPAEIRRQYAVVPVTVVQDRSQDEVLVVAIAAAANIAAIDVVRSVCGGKVQPVLASQEQIAAAIAALPPNGE